MSHSTKNSNIEVPIEVLFKVTFKKKMDQINNRMGLSYKDTAHAEVVAGVRHVWHGVM